LVTNDNLPSTEAFEIWNESKLLENLKSLDLSDQPICKQCRDISKKGKFRYIMYDDIQSTMDVDPDFDNTIVTAKTQSSGKGRKKNTWVSPRGAIYRRLFRNSFGQD